MEQGGSDENLMTKQNDMKPVLIVATPEERAKLAKTWKLPQSHIWIAAIPLRRIGWARFLASQTPVRQEEDFIYLTSTNASAIFAKDERARLIECVARFAHRSGLQVLMRLHPSESRKDVRRDIRKLRQLFPGVEMRIDRAPAIIRMAQAKFVVHISRSMAGMSSLTERPCIVFREIPSRSSWNGEEMGPRGFQILNAEREGTAATATSCREFEEWSNQVIAEGNDGLGRDRHYLREQPDVRDSSLEIAQRIIEHQS